MKNLEMPDIRVEDIDKRENEELRVDRFLQSPEGRDWLKNELGDGYERYMKDDQDVRQKVEEMVIEAKKEGSNSDLAKAANRWSEEELEQSLAA